MGDLSRRQKESDQAIGDFFRIGDRGQQRGKARIKAAVERAPGLKARTVMTFSSLIVESESGRLRYTRLFACISEEDDGYVVQVRLSNEAKPGHAAWGEEITDSFETASVLIAGLAAEHSIAQDRIEIEIRMETLTDGTRH
jgi:hypothetical protein